MCFGEHDAGVLVEEGELVIGQLFQQRRPPLVEDVPVEVVLRPHVLCSRTETRELGALLPRQQTDSHTEQSAPARRAPPLARRSAVAFARGAASPSRP